MNILALRTDNPIAEVGLYVDSKKLVDESWEAHRQLAETLHKKLQSLLDTEQLTWRDINGIVCYEGPGSFTGLRIGMSVANALAMSNSAPIVATTGEDWIQQGIDMLLSGKGNKAVVPKYGQPVHITQQRK